MHRAKLHLENELKKFGVQLGRGHYQLYDVHSDKELLAVGDGKAGVIMGGTDLILAPYGLHLLGVDRQTCVAFELKTEEAMRKCGIDSFTAEAALELIASNYQSNQITFVVLTDLCSEITLFTRSREDDSISIMAYENITISQGLQLIANHIAVDCVPQRHYQVECGEKVSDITLRAFKRKRVAPIGGFS